MKVLKSFQEIVQKSKQEKDKNNTVGLVTGAFDVLHMGHLNLFRLAKKTL